MHAPIAAENEDPTTQMPWPSSKRAADAPADDQSDAVLERESTVAPNSSVPAPTKKKLSTWGLITLSISMAGAQIAWTVELGYGTPFLLELGLTEQLTSLVWLAGPISGLVAQPVIGAISDSSPSKYRRRYWIIASTIVLVFATFILAYCQPLANFLVDVFGVGAGDWDEKRNRYANNTAIAFAIISFYLLDFALNALQASLRNLLLDIAPAAQLNSGNAWHGRMINAGNILGFGLGFLPLASIPLVRLLGGTQFRKFCLICILILVITVTITCVCHEEEERPILHAKQQNKFREVLDNIKEAIVNLPKPIRRVCIVQLFAFTGWFPFLFYATTYMGQIMAHEQDREPDPEVATRTGEFAMLIYSIVAVVAGTIIPHFANRDRRLKARKEDVSEDAEISRLRATVRQWRAEAARKGLPVHLPVMPFLLRNIWMAAMILFSVLTFSTFFISTVTQATIFISLTGICWAVAMWAPFAIIMELLKELQSPQAPAPRRHNRSVSGSDVPNRRGERQPLLRTRSHDDVENGHDEVSVAKPVAGGTVLGIHNLAIVVPQLAVAIITSLIFRIVDGEADSDPTNEGTYYGKNGVAWVLRFGGLITLIGAVVARMVPPTPTEKAMRRRLSEMQALQEERT